MAVSLSGRFLVLISVRGWVDPKAIVRLEELGKLKKSISYGLKPATFPLTNYATACPTFHWHMFNNFRDDTTSPVQVHFMFFVHRTHKKDVFTQRTQSNFIASSTKANRNRLPLQLPPPSEFRCGTGQDWSSYKRTALPTMLSDDSTLVTSYK
jgi:hypothetical protein